MKPTPLRLTREMIEEEAAEFEKLADKLEAQSAAAFTRKDVDLAKFLSGEEYLMRSEAIALRKWAETGGPAPEPPTLAGHDA